MRKFENMSLLIDLMNLDLDELTCNINMWDTTNHGTCYEMPMMGDSL